MEKHEAAPLGNQQTTAPRLTELTGGWAYEPSDFNDGYVLYGPQKRPVCGPDGSDRKFSTVLAMRVWLRDCQRQPDPFNVESS